MAPRKLNEQYVRMLHENRVRRHAEKLWRAGERVQVVGDPKPHNVAGEMERYETVLYHGLTTAPSWRTHIKTNKHGKTDIETVPITDAQVVREV